MKLLVFRLEFFKVKMEVFDAVIVITSLLLDIIFFNHTDTLNFIGLIIILRLWRVVRIVHGNKKKVIIPVIA